MPEELTTILRAEEAELAEIAAALERIRTGRYGLCEKTGGEIPVDVLRAVPWARHSVALTELAGRGHPDA